MIHTASCCQGHWNVTGNCRSLRPPKGWDPDLYKTFFLKSSSYTVCPELMPQCLCWDMKYQNKKQPVASAPSSQPLVKTSPRKVWNSLHHGTYYTGFRGDRPKEQRAGVFIPPHAWLRLTPEEVTFSTLRQGLVALILSWDGLYIKGTLKSVSDKLLTSSCCLVLSL